MTLMQYHALWVALALTGIAVASGLLTHHLRRRDLRRQQAEEALEALARYSEWLAAQRRAVFQGERPQPPLAQLCRIQQAGFPELAAALVALMQVHVLMLDFLWRQQALRDRDPEAWLESDHDGRFLALWREHCVAVHGLAERLRSAAGGPLVDAEPETVFPA